MPNPIPVLRSPKPVPVSAMDCISRADGILTPQLDDQLFASQGTLRADAKLLWQQQLVPYRAIKCVGNNVQIGGSDFNDLATRIQTDLTIWSSKDAVDSLSQPTFPLWGSNYEWFPGILPGINLWPEGSFGLPGNALYAWSSWAFTLAGGTFLPNTPVDPIKLLKWGVITQVLCPNAYRPQNYELWTVTTRSGIADPGEGDPGIIPAVPWGASSDFAKSGGGTLNPGQTLIIPCPIGKSPQMPPAPSGFDSPVTYGQYEGWGVSQFLIFK